MCEFGETVLFRYPGKLKDKGDTAWSTGIWWGRDTEADEHIVSTGTGTTKVRTIKRQVPSKQWDQKLFLRLQATPWDPKAKQAIDTSFVLPPTLTSTGRVREPPGLERETQTGTEDLPTEETHETVTETQDDLKRLKRLKLKPRLAPETRVRNEKRIAENQELPEDLLPDDKRLTFAAIGVFSVTLKDGTEVPVAVNEDTEEKQTEIKLNEPQLLRTEPEFPDELVIEGMQKEMKSMKEFDVYEEVPIEQCSQEDIDSALDCKWVKCWKTANTVRCRLTARGCFQETWIKTLCSQVHLHWWHSEHCLFMMLSRAWSCFTCDKKHCVSSCTHDGPCNADSTKRVLLGRTASGDWNEQCVVWSKRQHCGNNTFVQRCWNSEWGAAKLIRTCTVIPLAACMSFAT